MKERQLEAAYRARLDERRRAGRALADLYEEISAGRESAERAWMYGAARPRVPAAHHDRMTKDEARAVLAAAQQIAPRYARKQTIHPLEYVDVHNPRPGLRRWVAPTTVETGTSAWKAARASVHNDGSVTLAAAAGAARNRDGADPAWLVHGWSAERFVTDLMALVRAAARHHNLGEYEVTIGMEWAGEQALLIAGTDMHGFTWTDGSIPLHRYVPVTATVHADLDTDGFREQIWEIATDVVNQGGVQNLNVIEPPPPSK